MKYSKIVNEDVQIFLDGPIGYEMGSAFADELRMLAKIYEKITIHINSPGGQVIGEWTIISAILDIQSKGIIINTQIDGIAGSAAAIIALAGNQIAIRDYATIMIHKTHDKSGGLNDEELKILSLMDQSTYKILGNRIDETTINKWLESGDVWFSASEAKEFGLVDMIIETNIEVAVDAEALDSMYLQYSKILKAADDEKQIDIDVEDIPKVVKYLEYLAQKLSESISYTEALAKMSYDDFDFLTWKKKGSRLAAEKWMKKRNI